jgi:hypothetical protein
MNTNFMRFGRYTGTSKEILLKYNMRMLILEGLKHELLN